MALLGALWLLSGSQARADWPFARGGPDSTGAAAVTLPPDPGVLWTYDTGGSALEATPVIADGVAYLGDADGTLHAVRLSDGTAVWKKSFAGTFLLSPAAVFEGTVYLADADGVVRALAASDGAPRWEFDAESEAYGGPVVHRVDAARVLVLAPTEAGKLFALDAATGAQVWSFAIDAPLRCTPTVVGGNTLLAACDGRLHVVDVATGAEVGVCAVGDPTGNTAAIAKGTAYFGTEGGAFVAVEAVDPAAPKVKWTFRDTKRGQGVRTAAALTGGAVVFASQAKTLYALDATTGKELWRQRARAAIEASPLALADGRVVVLSSRGRVAVLDGRTGEERWSYEAGGGFVASPAAADGRLLVANTDGVLTCFGD